jgi:Na+-transporting NADH:ubiquinone oxidoreductase subunit A
LTPNKKYDLNTSLNGEGRAFVMSGQYDKVFPMDVLPVQLIKAAMINDIESMENLGIYEVSPEDFALCEFVCTSKIDSQAIIRKGLDLIKQECG